MNYSRTAFLSLLVLFIINFDVVRNRHYRSGTPVAQAYRGFILSVMAFCASDALWGVLYDARLITPVYQAPGGVEALNEACDYAVFPLANAFRPGFNLKPMTDMIRRLTIPCVVIGCGLLCLYVLFIEGRKDRV